MITNFDNTAFLQTLPDPAAQKSANGKLTLLFAIAVTASLSAFYFYSQMKELEKELHKRMKQ
jgi:hypothetical protein